MRDQLRLLLLQIRNPDDPMREHEHDCFVRAARVTADQIVPIDALTLEFQRTRLADFDALLVGGSGDYSCARPHAAFFGPMLDFLRRLVRRDYPIFASCFGFHAISTALGARVITDAANMEVGTFDVQLTAAGRSDPLFAELGERFDAQMGHKDRLAAPPDGVETLVRGDVIECHAYRVRGRRIWATQFHPELTAADNRHRYLHYFQHYPGADPDQAVLESLRETPETHALVARFVDSLLRS